MKTSQLREVTSATNVTGRVQDLAAEIIRLREALAEIKQWIDGWSPSFTDDDEWDPTAANIRALLTEHDE